MKSISSTSIHIIRKSAKVRKYISVCVRLTLELKHYTFGMMICEGWIMQRNFQFIERDVRYVIKFNISLYYYNTRLIVL